MYTNNKKIKIKIPAAKIREITHGQGEIEQYVNELLTLIEEDIENAIENQQQFAMTELNTIFDVPYMSNKDAQRDIYYLMAQALIKAGYYPRIKYLGTKAENQRVFVYTRWNTAEDVTINKYKDTFLKQIAIKPNTYESRFIEQHLDNTTKKRYPLHNTKKNNTTKNNKRKYQIT